MPEESLTYYTVQSSMDIPRNEEAESQGAPPTVPFETAEGSEQEAEDSVKEAKAPFKELESSHENNENAVQSQEQERIAKEVANTVKDNN